MSFIYFLLHRHFKLMPNIYIHFFLKINMSLTTAVDFLLRLFQEEGQSIAGCLRFLVFLIMLLVLPSVDLTADNRKLDIRCHPETNDSLTQECLLLYSAETRSLISPHFLVWITASLVSVLWSTITFFSAKQLPKIKGMTDHRKKEPLCREFWNKCFLHVCSEAVVVAVSLAYLCYTQKMYLTENTFDCHLKNDVTCSIEHHRDIENPTIIIIGGMSTILLFCVLTICDAICNKEAFIKDLVNSSTGKEEGSERLEINVQPLK